MVFGRVEAVQVASNFFAMSFLTPSERGSEAN